VRVLRVLRFAERRGSADDARALWEDLAPAAGRQKAPQPGAREAGAGRPTKRERREIEKFTADDEF
jgi:ribosome-associated heat shock protein Hsp15